MPNNSIRSLSGKAAIVGVNEADEIGVVPNKTILRMQAEAVRNALQDAGLGKSDVEGLFTTYMPHTLAEYTGIKPKYVDGTMVGGCSFIIHLEHALLAIEAGIINTAIIVHGESGRSRVGGSAFTRISGDPSLQFHMPFGAVRPACNFGLAASRHMAVYGTTREQMAKQCVAQRQWALLHPKALMRDKGSITVEDVLNSRPVCWPFTLLMCCLVTDAAAAVVVTSVERAKNLPRKPIYILGTGEASEHSEISQMADLTTSQAAGVSGKRAFEMAGLTPKDINVAELYDAFVFTPMLALEDLGFCKPGESGPFVADGRTAPGGSFPMNTNGGGLNFTHSGMYGIHTIIECVRQLRGEAGERQVPNATYGICHGPGGMFASAGTAILGNQVS